MRDSLFMFPELSERALSSFSIDKGHALPKAPSRKFPLLAPQVFGLIPPSLIPLLFELRYALMDTHSSHNFYPVRSTLRACLTTGCSSIPSSCSALFLLILSSRREKDLFGRSLKALLIASKLCPFVSGIRTAQTMTVVSVAKPKK